MAPRLKVPTRLVTGVTTLLRASRFDEGVVTTEEAVELEPTSDRARGESA